MTCIGNDPHCPCQDGDACHYVTYGDSKAMPIPDPDFGLAPLKQEGGSFCYCGASAGPGEELIHKPGCEPLKIQKDAPLRWYEALLMIAAVLSIGAALISLIKYIAG